MRSTRLADGRQSYGCPASAKMPFTKWRAMAVASMSGMGIPLAICENFPPLVSSEPLFRVLFRHVDPFLLERASQSDTNLLHVLAVAASRTVAGSSPNFSPPPPSSSCEPVSCGPCLRELVSVQNTDKTASRPLPTLASPSQKLRSGQRAADIRY
ncbi:hypothetical protein T02_11133 [Trichinella nativa]|uniref:Uncharacterized protein n=1 Tax=Trichinella nativa TaxID=6335 RepID=A0A0V1KK43_9BILA|nr:hypothetical protein T02_11133 [Trichinella nativa]